MQHLIEQERFELEVLDRINSKKMLGSLIFCGGTALRLCFGLNRFSVDLDFWIRENIDQNKFFKTLKAYLAQFYTLTDSANKFHTMLFEIKSSKYPRKLKIEIRKEAKKIKSEAAIAYSKYSNLQVFLRTVPLKDMLNAKIEAFLSRKEIRDAFDMEFILKRGVGLDLPFEILKKVLSGIDSFTKKDYQVKLGSILGKEERAYYVKENFKIIKNAIKEKLNQQKNPGF